MRIITGHSAVSGRMKIKAIVGKYPAVVPSDLRAVSVKVLQSLAGSCEEYVTMDRGHSHSSGESEASFWLSARPCINQDRTNDNSDNDKVDIDVNEVRESNRDAWQQGDGDAWNEGSAVDEHTDDNDTEQNLNMEDTRAGLMVAIEQRNATAVTHRDQLQAERTRAKEELVRSMGITAIESCLAAFSEILTSWPPIPGQDEEGTRQTVQAMILEGCLNIEPLRNMAPENKDALIEICRIKTNDFVQTMKATYAAQSSSTEQEP